MRPPGGLQHVLQALPSVETCRQAADGQPDSWRCSNGRIVHAMMCRRVRSDALQVRPVLCAFSVAEAVEIYMRPAGTARRHDEGASGDLHLSSEGHKEG